MENRPGTELPLPANWNHCHNVSRYRMVGVSVQTQVPSQRQGYGGGYRLDISNSPRQCNDGRTVRFIEGTRPRSECKQSLAMPPENSHPKLTIIKPEWRRENGSPEWTYRFETGCWQADIFLDVRPLDIDKVPEAEPIYVYFDALSNAEPHIIKSMQETPPWPQQHETFNSTMKAVYKGWQRRGRAQAPRALHQRYG